MCFSNLSRPLTWENEHYLNWDFAITFPTKLCLSVTGQHKGFCFPCSADYLRLHIEEKKNALNYFSSDNFNIFVYQRMERSRWQRVYSWTQKTTTTKKLAGTASPLNTQLQIFYYNINVNSNIK